MVKSVRQTIPTYAMSVFRIPKGCCEDFTRMLAKFW